VHRDRCLAARRYAGAHRREIGVIRGALAGCLPRLGHHRLTLPLVPDVAGTPADSHERNRSPVLALGIVAQNVLVIANCSFGAALLRRGQLLEAIAAPRRCMLGGTGNVSLWRIFGGWADEIDWSMTAAEIANKTPLWEKVFEELDNQCTGLLERWSVEDAAQPKWVYPSPSAAEALEQAGPAAMAAALAEVGLSLDKLGEEEIAEVLSATAANLGADQFAPTWDLCSKAGAAHRGLGQGCLRSLGHLHLGRHAA
jgi:hypothetical protein